MGKCSCGAVVLVAALVLMSSVSAGAGFEVVCVEDGVHGYATFQSHNQKVVANAHGVFMTYLRSRNEAYTAQGWRLERSVDGGKTFATVFEAVDATNPAVLETDAAGNVYLVRPDFVDGNAYLYRFLAEKDFKDPAITTIPNGAAGKFCLFLDEARGQLYYFAHNNTFHVIGLDGVVRRSVTLLAGGEHAVLQYPLLSMARDGTLYAAWTTQKHGEYMYWDIHFMCSRDAGESWCVPGGSALTLPIVADDGGPAPRITLDDEFDAHTWLSSFVFKEDKLHFFYLAQSKPPREHYMRYDAATGKRELNMQPAFAGDTLSIRGLDGFFATREGKPLYAIGNGDGHLVCLVSRDNGATWKDYARSEEHFNLYAIGGFRRITDDGYIIGSFTDSKPVEDLCGQNSRACFFKLAVPK